MFIVSCIFSSKANKCILPICTILITVSMFLDVQGNKIQNLYQIHLRRFLKLKNINNLCKIVLKGQ